MPEYRMVLSITLLITFASPWQGPLNEGFAIEN